jgi:hypothetical protein
MAEDICRHIVIGITFLALVLPTYGIVLVYRRILMRLDPGATGLNRQWVNQMTENFYIAHSLVLIIVAGLAAGLWDQEFRIDLVLASGVLFMFFLGYASWLMLGAFKAQNLVAKQNSKAALFILSGASLFALSSLVAAAIQHKPGAAQAWGDIKIWAATGAWVLSVAAAILKHLIGAKDEDDTDRKKRDEKKPVIGGALEVLAKVGGGAHPE